MGDIEPRNPGEAGIPEPDPKPNAELPPGNAKWVTPPYQQSISIWNWISRSYPWTHDEALRDSSCNAEAMWLDPVISTAVRDRQRPVCQLEAQIEPRNGSDDAENAAAQAVMSIINSIPRFQQMKRCLLDAIWLGRSGIQFKTNWDFSSGEKSIQINDWSPIHGDSIVFKWDGTIGWLINPMARGEPGVTVIEGRGGLAKFCDPHEQECVLVHEFEPTAMSYYKPELAAQIHGSGYRGRIYWYWWLKHNLMKILMDFMKKVGNGFFLAGYAAGNRDELAVVQTALESQTGSSNIYVPLDQSRTGLDEIIKQIPINMSGSDFQWTVINGLNSIIRQSIMGEIGTTGGMSTGLGSDMGEQHGMTADERTKYDATDLETPMQKLTNFVYKYVYPGMLPGRFRFLADKRNPGEVMEACKFALEAGMAVPQPWVQQQLGIPALKKGEASLANVQSQQATALNAVPGGTPITGQPGPEVAPDAAGGQPAAQDGTAQLEQQIKPMEGS